MTFAKIAVAGALVALSILPASAQELTGTLKKIKETGAITIAYRDSSVPFSYLDDNQKAVGYAMDICLYVAADVRRRRVPGPTSIR